MPRGGAPGETVSAREVYLSPQPGGPYGAPPAAARPGLDGEAAAPGSRGPLGMAMSSASKNGGSFEGGSSGGAGGGGGAADGGAAVGEEGGQGGNMTKRQLRELAQRRGLDYGALLEDAAARGIALADE